MTIPSINDEKQEAADTAGECPGCGWEADVTKGHVSHSESHGEDYYSILCHDCQQWQYNHHSREWLKLTPPGEENPTVQR